MLDMTEAVISFFGREFSPKASFSVFGLALNWNGVLIALAFLAGVIYAVSACKKYGLSSDNVSDLIIIAVPCAVVGARLFYVLGHLSDFEGNALEALYFWHGGMSGFGGILFSLAGWLIVCKKKKLSFAAVLDLGSLSLLAALAIAVWGDFFNRQNYGSLTSLPWAMTLSFGSFEYAVHPLFLYRFLLYAASFLLLHFLFEKRGRRYDGELFCFAAVCFCLTHVITDQLASDAVGMVWKRLVCALAVCFGVLFLLHQAKHVTHKPEELFVNGGEAFRLKKRSTKGRYGDYYDDEINDETDEMSVGATYDTPAPADEDDDFETFITGNGEPKADAEEENDGFESFVTGSASETEAEPTEETKE